jgi:hypothetical protein
VGYVRRSNGLVIPYSDGGASLRSSLGFLDVMSANVCRRRSNENPAVAGRILSGDYFARTVQLPEGQADLVSRF